LAHFKNFAKLKDTSIEFNDITVLAGKPSTGKSYVMKYFYAINDMFYQKNKDNLLNLKEDEKRLEHDFFLHVYWEDGLDKKLDNAIKKRDYELLFDLVHNYTGYNQNELNNLILKIKEKSELLLDKKIEFYLNNLIKSIFTNHNQISNSYQVVYQDMVLKYQNDDR